MSVPDMPLVGQTLTFNDVFVTRTYRKITARLIPLLLLCYLCAYIDRINIGFAKLQMLQDLRFSETVYGLGAGVFFIGYALFEIPSNLILYRVGARKWIARIMITWGIISGLMLLVHTPLQFYILRFLLGVAEAGFAPGVFLYLTSWFPDHQRGSRVALFMMSVPLAGLIGSPLSGLILKVFSGADSLAGWQWLFLLEAIPSVLMGLLIFFFLKDTPKQAPWLSEDEKQMLEQELANDNSAKEAHGSVVAFLKDKRLWFLSALYFCITMSQYAITFWLPTIISETGVKNVVLNGVLSAIPFLVAAVAMPILGRHADITRERRWHLILALVVGGVALAISPLVSSVPALALFFLSIAAGGLLAATPLFWPLPMSFLRGMSVAAGIALINSLGNVAGFVSPSIVGALTDLTGTTNAGIFVTAAVAGIGVLLVFILPAKTINR